MSNSRSHTLKNAVSVSAAGSNSQANATVLQRSPVTLITVCSASSRSVRLPGGIVTGNEMLLSNETAATCKVYPATGDKVTSNATNAAYSLLANTSHLFVKGTGNRWNLA